MNDIAITIILLAGAAISLFVLGVFVTVILHVIRAKFRRWELRAAERADARAIAAKRNPRIQEARARETRERAWANYNEEAKAGKGKR